MQKRNRLLSYSIYTFAFIYSGTVISCPYYTSGKPVVNYLLSAVSAVLYAYFAARYFSNRDFVKQSPINKIFVFGIILTAIISGAFMLTDYIKSFVTFSDYYAGDFVSVFTLCAVIICSVYCAYKGRVCMEGFSGLVFVVFILWTLSGFFAFFTTHNAVIPDAPFSDISISDFVFALKGVLYVCFDITVIGVILCSGKSSREREVVPDAMVKGAFAFALLTGINLARNLLLFGEEFSLDIANPDLAAIRLIPMFELPEISIIVNTFACAIRLSGYFHLAFFVIKQMFKKKYNSRMVCIGGFVLSVAAYMLVYILNSSRNIVLFTCMAICSLLCYMCFSKSYKEHNKTK